MINAGGLIAIYMETKHSTPEEGIKKVEEIEEKIAEISRFVYDYFYFTTPTNISLKRPSLT